MPRLVVLSIDGMHPSAYLDGGGPAPFLASLARRGAFASGSVPVYPSLTMTNHASLVTGARSARHGIFGNTVFDPARVDQWQGGESKEWYRYASSIRARTLWDAAVARGRSVAMLHWPVSVGARVDWLVPEIFALPSDGNASTRDLLRRHCTPGLFGELAAANGDLRDTDDHAGVDEWLARAALHLLRRGQPDLLLAHFSSYDHEAHEHGRDHPRALGALRKIDGWVAAIAREAERVIVLGDHGFLDFTGRLHVNALFRERGWIDVDGGGRITGWRVIAHTNCGQAFVYAESRGGRGLAAEARALLEAHAGKHFRLIDRAELDRLGACPGAIYAVDARAGFSMGQNLAGPWIERIGRTRGEHGYLAEGEPRLHAGLVLAGPGIARGRDLGLVELIDVAPTVAELLGLGEGALPDAEGRSLLPVARRSTAG